MLETLKAERIPCKLSEMQTGSVVDCTWKKLFVKVLPSLTVPLMHQVTKERTYQWLAGLLLISIINLFI